MIWNFLNCLNSENFTTCIVKKLKDVIVNQNGRFFWKVINFFFLLEVYDVINSENKSFDKKKFNGDKDFNSKKIVFVNFSNEWLCFNDYVNSGTKIHWYEPKTAHCIPTIVVIFFTYK